MGTLCNFGPEEFVAIGQALSALPNLVIWKLASGDLPGNVTVEALKLGSNVKVSSEPCYVQILPWRAARKPCRRSTDSKCISLTLIS